MAATWTTHHRYFSPPELNPTITTDQFEFDEAEIWSSTNNTNTNTNTNKSTPRRKIRKPVREDTRQAASGPRSLPVNIPDWSKILRTEYRKSTVGEFDDDGEEDDSEERNDRIAPHEYLLRTRVASLSVHEGAGRTLKGRDLSRVRDAIWKRTGFED